jgi:hypothetical protein
LNRIPGLFGNVRAIILLLVDFIREWTCWQGRSLGAQLKDENKLVVVRDFLNKAEAELAQGALQAQGVRSIVQADDAGGEEPGLWMGGVKLLVWPEDVKIADEILGPAK